MNILLSFTDNKYSEMNNNNFYNIIFKSHDKELYIKLLLFTSSELDTLKKT